jgi:hypothetical protein
MDTVSTCFATTYVSSVRIVSSLRVDLDSPIGAEKAHTPHHCGDSMTFLSEANGATTGYVV